MDARDAARSLSIGRLAVGTTLLLAPSLGAGPWVGRMTPGTRLLARAVGVRDAGLAAAVLAGLAGRAPLRAVLAAGVAADTTDLVATLLERDHLPRMAVPVVVAAAGGGIVAGLVALAGVDDGAAPVPA